MKTEIDKLLKSIYVRAFLIATIGTGFFSSCKNALNDSKPTSLDNFSAGANLRLNDCRSNVGAIADGGSNSELAQMLPLARSYRFDDTVPEMERKTLIDKYYSTLSSIPATLQSITP